MARSGRTRAAPTPRAQRIARATGGTTVSLGRKPTPRSSRYCMTPQIASRPKALPPARSTPSSVGTRWRGSRNSSPCTPAAQPRISTPPTAGAPRRSAADVVEARAAEGALGGHLEPARGQRAHEGDGRGWTVGVGERGRGGGGGRGLVAALGPGEDVGPLPA